MGKETGCQKVDPNKFSPRGKMLYDYYQMVRQGRFEDEELARLKNKSSIRAGLVRTGSMIALVLGTLGVSKNVQVPSTPDLNVYQGPRVSLDYFCDSGRIGVHLISHRIPDQDEALTVQSFDMNNHPVMPLKDVVWRYDGFYIQNFGPRGERLPPNGPETEGEIFLPEKVEQEIRVYEGNFSETNLLKYPPMSKLHINPVDCS